MSLICILNCHQAELTCHHFLLQFNPAIRAGQLWRVVTSAFLHADVWHLGLNMWILTAEGAECEKLVGSSRMLVVYAAAVLAGNFASFPTSLGTSGEGMPKPACEA